MHTAAVGIDAGDQAYALNIRGVAFEGDDAAPVDLSFLQVLPIDFIMVVVDVVDVSHHACNQGRGESLPWFPLPRDNASFAPRLDGGVQVQRIQKLSHIVTSCVGGYSGGVRPHLFLH